MFVAFSVTVAVATTTESLALRISIVNTIWSVPRPLRAMLYWRVAVSACQVLNVPIVKAATPDTRVARA